MKSAPAIVFDYAPSRRVAAAIGAVAIAGLVALSLCAMPWWAKVVAAALAVAYAAFSMSGFLQSAVRRAAWYDAGHWRIADGQGADHLAELQDGVVRGSWIVLRLRRSNGKRIAMILGPDNSDADLRRRLRVRLARAREEIT